MWSRNRKPLIAAVLISITLHVGVMVTTMRDSERAIIPDRQRDSIAITLERHSIQSDRGPTTENVAPQSRILPVEEDEPAADPVEKDGPTEQTVTDTPAPEPEQLSSNVPTLSEKALTSLVNQGYVDAFEAYSASACNPLERSSVVRVCFPPEVMRGVDVEVLAGVFADSNGSGGDFERDMETVDHLLVKMSHLQPLDPSDPHQAALVAEQRQHMHQEILRIDRKYQGVNLLRLIPISARAVKGLRETMSRRKP